MAITLVSSASNSGTGTSNTVTIPATTVNADDYIIVWYVNREETSAPSSEDLDGAGGYTGVCTALQTTFGSGGWSRAYYKKAVGGEESDVLTITESASESFIMGVGVFRGVDTSSPFDVTVTHGTYHTEFQNDNAPAAASLTTVTDGAWILCFSRAASTSTGLTTISSDSGTDLFNVVFNTAYGSIGTYEEIATAGANGGDVHTYTGFGASSADGHMLILALRPATTGGALPLVNGGLVAV